MQLHRALHRRFEAARVVEHAVDMADDVGGAHLQCVVERVQAAGRAHAADGALEALVAPFLQRVELLLAEVLQSSRLAPRLEQFVPVAKRPARVEQLALALLELFAQRLAQVEVSVDHAVEDAQHQLLGLGRQPRTSSGQQPVADRGHQPAVGGAHGDQHLREQEEHRGSGLHADHAGRLDRVGADRQPAEHDHLVVVGRIEVRRMARILRVEQMVLEDAGAGELLRRRGPGAAVVVDAIAPDEAPCGHRRHRIGDRGAVGADDHELHRGRLLPAFATRLRPGALSATRAASAPCRARNR